MSDVEVVDQAAEIERLKAEVAARKQEVAQKDAQLKDEQMGKLQDEAYFGDGINMQPIKKPKRGQSFPKHVNAVLDTVKKITFKSHPFVQNDKQMEHQLPRHH